MQTKIDFASFEALLKGDRTVRRFREREGLPEGALRKLVGLTRYCASGRNAQPLKYRCVESAGERERVFPLLAWAGYYKDWDGPQPGERPAGYLVQCVDRSICPGALLCDDGLELQAITLGASTLGLGCCIIKSFQSDALREALGLAPGLEPIYVVAIGRPAEQVRLADIGPDGDFKYFRDPVDGVQTVPKRRLDERLIE